MVVADCTGHGVPGAFMTLIGVNLLDKIIKVDKILRPDLILNALHIEVSSSLKQTVSASNNGMDMVVFVLDKTEGHLRLSFAGAKNNLFIWSNDELIELKGIRKSIGGFQSEDKVFEFQEIQLQKGDLIYLGSDGFEDQNNDKRKKLGRKIIKSTIQQYHHLALSQQKEIFENILNEHMRGSSQRDDILWMGLKMK
ncbi:MAG: serine/threonine-protein phosphatase [Saprospiraceae bacterium]|nr:serine/threonine-protein phosphatase [Saprospiraceae bacterium]